MMRRGVVWLGVYVVFRGVPAAVPVVCVLCPYLSARCNSGANIANNFQKRAVAGVFFDTAVSAGRLCGFLLCRQLKHRAFNHVDETSCLRGSMDGGVESFL